LKINCTKRRVLQEQAAVIAVGSGELAGSIVIITASELNPIFCQFGCLSYPFADI
jgi:hypothetical protein